MRDNVRLITDADLPTTDWDTLELKLVKNISCKNYVGRKEVMREAILSDAESWGLDAVYINETISLDKDNMDFLVSLYKVK